MGLAFLVGVVELLKRGVVLEPAHATIEVAFFF